MKRCFDLLFALTGLILLSPLFLSISIFIWVNDRGPVFFKHRRIGRYGKPFNLYKFRSMSQRSSATNESFEPGDKSRITAVGKILRKTKLDELPQLMNILMGEMSLVGPRPEVEKWVNIYPDRWKVVLSVKPGMTDNASILFRSEESILAGSEDPVMTYQEEILPRKLDLYEDYVRNRSFWGDLRLIFKTLIYLFTKK
jgi:lipopolysaccharide/colanic/teichoic acid biosynthesis glycosyltransferase